MICVDWVACVLMGAGFLGLGPGTGKARPTPMRTEPRKQWSRHHQRIGSNGSRVQNVNTPDAAPRLSASVLRRKCGLKSQALVPDARLSALSAGD
jgi:hypothetical protein